MFTIEFRVSLRDRRHVFMNAVSRVTHAGAVRCSYQCGSLDITRECRGGEVLCAVLPTVQIPYYF